MITTLPMTNSAEAPFVGSPSAPPQRAGRKGHSRGAGAASPQKPGHPAGSPLADMHAQARAASAAKPHGATGPAASEASRAQAPEFARVLHLEARKAPSKAAADAALEDAAPHPTRLGPADDDKDPAEAVVANATAGLPVNTAWPQGQAFALAPAQAPAALTAAPATEAVALSPSAQAKPTAAIAPAAPSAAAANTVPPPTLQAPALQAGGQSAAHPSAPLPKAIAPDADRPLPAKTVPGTPLRAHEAVATVAATAAVQGDGLSPLNVKALHPATQHAPQAAGAALISSTHRALSGATVTPNPTANTRTLSTPSAATQPVPADGAIPTLVLQPPRSAQALKAEAGPSVLSVWASDARTAKPLMARSTDDIRTSSEAVGPATLHPMMASPAAPSVASAFSVGGDRGLLHAHIDTPTSSPEFHSSLASSVRGLMRQGGQAQFSLNPVEMGPITVKVDLQGDQARVTFAADAAATRDLLEKSQPWLSQALGEAGVRLVQTQINAPSDARSMASQQQHAGQGQTPNQQQGGSTEPGGYGSQAQHHASHSGSGQSQPSWSQAAHQAGLPVAKGTQIDTEEPAPAATTTPAPGQRGLHTVV